MSSSSVEAFMRSIWFRFFFQLQKTNRRAKQSFVEFSSQQSSVILAPDGTLRNSLSTCRLTHTRPSFRWLDKLFMKPMNAGSARVSHQCVTVSPCARTAHHLDLDISNQLIFVIIFSPRNVDTWKQARHRSMQLPREITWHWYFMSCEKVKWRVATRNANWKI